MATRTRKRSVNPAERTPLGRIMKRENPVGLYGVVALINDVMDKNKMTLKEVAHALPYSYTSMCSIYHSKRPAPTMVIVGLAKMIHVEPVDYTMLALEIVENEMGKKPNRVEAVKAEKEDPNRVKRKRRKKVED